VHASSAQQIGKSLAGKGVHEAARIASKANGGEILASAETAAGSAYTTSSPRTLELKGISEPMNVVQIDWK
jgi:class 3 adenylate cyclase